MPLCSMHLPSPTFRRWPTGNGPPEPLPSPFPSTLRERNNRTWSNEHDKVLGTTGNACDSRLQRGNFVMRNPRLPVWARSAAFATALTFAVAGQAPDAVAEFKYNQLFVFGDSYADVTLSDKPASNPHAPAGVHLDVWRVYPVPLKEGLGIPEIQDFAIGGATTGSLPGQVDNFLSTGVVLSPRDLVTINIGGNDGIGYTLIVKDLANAPLAGQLAAVNAAAQIKRLVDAGGQTFVIGAFSGLSGLPFITNNGGNPAVGDAFGAAYFQALQLQLLPMAQAGARFFLLDEFRLGQQVQADPARYGLVGINCPGGGTVCGGSINSPDQQKYFLGPDGLHLTNRGFEIVAAYMANIVMAPDTIAVQPASSPPRPTALRARCSTASAARASWAALPELA